MKLIIFTLFVGAVVAELAVFKKCDDYSNDVCEVSEIRITPCKQPKRCRLKKGISTSISFDFTPQFSSDKMQTGVFWASNAGDVPFPEVQDADACTMTSCPVQAGKKQEFNYGLELSKKLPNGKFTFKWLLWNPDDKTQACCFLTDIELKR